MQNILSVQSLTKKFDDFTAVKDISFNVKTGSIFAFLGPNGAGKSTTIKMLTTVLKPTTGEISINGFNALKEQDRARASFGIVFQDHSLDEELTAYENIVYQTRRSIWNHIKSLNQEKGMTIFLTTHYMEEAEAVADHIAIIDHGKIIESGTVEEIKKRTETESLEDAFLKLTGRDIRDENNESGIKMRTIRSMRRRNRN